MKQNMQQDKTKAGLDALSPELLLHVFEQLIPPAWHETVPNPLSLLRLRSVSRKFDQLISEKVLKNIRWTLNEALPDPKFETTCWLLRTKLSQHDAAVEAKEVKDMIFESARFMAEPQNFPSRSLQSSEADYLVAASRALTIVYGTQGVLDTFICLNEWRDVHQKLKRVEATHDTDPMASPWDKNVQYHGALQLVSGVGDAAIVQTLLDAGVKPILDHRLHIFGSALSVAARCGQLEVVRLLAPKANKTDLCWRGTRNPLYLAIDGGHEKVVEYLLDHFELCPNRGISGRLTLLGLAAKHGRESVVRMLLGRADVDPNYKSSYKRPTPLHWAIHHQHATIVELLLAHERTDPNEPSSQLTPLEKAIERNDTSTALLVLNNPRTDAGLFCQLPDPLIAACRARLLDVIRALTVRTEVDPNNRLDANPSPLPWAVQRGDGAVVEALLATPRVDPNIVGQGFGHTAERPIHMAAESGSLAVLRHLLARPDIDLHAQSETGTALTQAIRAEKPKSVRLLLSMPALNPNVLSEPGCTLASGHGLVALLRGDEDAQEIMFTGRTGYTGMTPLSEGILAHRKSIFSLLLNDPRTQHMKPDAGNRTPLWWAALKASQEHVRRLRPFAPHGEGVNIRSEVGYTALIVAAHRGEVGVVRELLEYPNIDPNVTTVRGGWTALHMAAYRVDLDVVLALLRHPRTDREPRDHRGLRPVDLAERQYGKRRYPRSEVLTVVMSFGMKTGHELRVLIDRIGGGRR